MVRFALVSEHSYGNAIDISPIALKGGCSIKRAREHFGKLEHRRWTAVRDSYESWEQVFDRELVTGLARALCDAAHRDYVHFDIARYRVDGSRPR